MSMGSCGTFLRLHG